jgi:DNA polymerase-1
MYGQFWRWSEQNVTNAMLTSKMQGVFGWQRHIGPNPNPRSLTNWPMQSAGAEMLRLAAIAATEAGIEVCALIHDAVLIQVRLDQLDGHVAHMREIMTRAGNAVTGGLDIRTEAKVIRWPDRYMADGAEPMWRRIMKLLDEVEAST